MDTKSKNFKNKYLITLIVLIMGISASIAMLSSYSNIDKVSKSSNYNPLDDAHMLDNLYEFNYILYKNNIDKKNKSTSRAVDILVNENTIQSVAEKKLEAEGYDKQIEASNKIEIKNRHIDQLKRNFDENFIRFENLLYNDYANLEYYIIDKESKIENTNSIDPIKQLDSKYNKGEDVTETTDKDKPTNISDNLSDEEITKLKEKYSFYTVIDYDSDGNINIRDSYGFNQKNIERVLLRMPGSGDEYNGNGYEYNREPIKNTTIIYAIPKVLNHQDDIYWNIRNENRYKYYVPSQNYMAIIGIFVLFIGLIIPYRYSKNLLGFETISKIPFEINAIIITFIFIFMNQNGSELIRTTLEGEMLEHILELGLNIDISNLLLNGFNLLYWTMYYLIIIIIVILLKHILSRGIKKYLGSHSIIFTALAKGMQGAKRYVKSIKEIDFSKKSTKVIATVLVINLTILIIISSLWFYGIILAIIYTVVMFKLLRKNYNEILEKYNKLLDVTDKIAQGDLDTNTDENLGVFEPIKIKLESIQSGFKKAVEEEVKSQNMKTELISNVSHDLKTPLTSIITYVDLLKDENIDGDKRKLYIDTLDKKSQRLQVLIEDLFEMSKASSKNINLNIEDVDIVSLMKQTLLELNDKTCESSLIFKNNFPENKVILSLDGQRTFRVFENLIINISKYSMPNSRVYIDILEKDKTVEIILKNISAQELDFNPNDIVERFVRGDKSRNTEGSGLGLAISKSFVELQGGMFNIDLDGDLFKVIIVFNKN
ncbi:MAG: sensor histidine kinase [Romboutsia sp.]